MKAFTFVNGSEAFSYPVAAAAELNPHPAISWNQDIGNFISAKPACETHTQKQTL